MSKIKSTALLLTGVLLGSAISQPAVHAGLQAVPSTQKFFANGEQIQMEAYNINGSNYVKLRDVGKTVGFQVSYDAAANSVYIGERPAAESYLANGQAITEENVLAMLREIEQQWPTGTVWGDRNTPGNHKNEVPSTEASRVLRGYGTSSVYGCGGYAAMVSSLLFGDKDNPARKLDDPKEMRPGDILLVVSPEGEAGHVAVVLETPNQEGRFHITDGNNGKTVVWPDSPDLRTYSLTGFSNGYRLEVWTRYPEK